MLELLKHNFGPGDRLVATQLSSPEVAAQAYRTRAGRKLLLINKSDTSVSVNLPSEDAGARLDEVDTLTGENPPQSSTVSGTQVTLPPFAVAVIFTPNP